MISISEPPKQAFYGDAWQVRQEDIPMLYRGIVKGKTIELEGPPPFPQGSAVTVSIEHCEADLPPGSPSLVRRAMNAAPELSSEDVDELERSIAEGRIPVQNGGPFDNDL